MSITPIENPVERGLIILKHHQQLINYMPEKDPDEDDIASLLCDIRLYCDHACIDFYRARRFGDEIYPPEKIRLSKNENK